MNMARQGEMQLHLLNTICCAFQVSGSNSGNNNGNGNIGSGNGNGNGETYPRLQMPPLHASTKHQAHMPRHWQRPQLHLCICSALQQSSWRALALPGKHFEGRCCFAQATDRSGQLELDPGTTTVGLQIHDMPLV